MKTGFYSSPHLLNVTERIRLNGEPITKVQFSQYFWTIYNTLVEKKVGCMSMTILHFIYNWHGDLSILIKTYERFMRNIVFLKFAIHSAKWRWYAAVFQVSHNYGLLYIFERKSRCGCGRSWYRRWIWLYECCTVNYYSNILLFTWVKSQQMLQMRKKYSKLLQKYPNRRHYIAWLGAHSIAWYNVQRYCMAKMRHH